MVSMKNNILFYTLFNIFGHVVSLVELSAVEDNDFRITETIIRESFSNLLSTFDIKDVNQNQKLNQFSTIHNFFVSITMKYFDNLKEIVNLTRVNNIDNNTRHFIAKINEVLDEGDKSIEERDDIHVITHIEAFITKLRYLKEIHGYNKQLNNLSVNADVLKILKNDEKYFDNFTYEINKNDTANDNDEVWSTTETSGRRIFQGHRTRVKYFPFMASVHFFEKFQCAGSIIREDLVITAASCLQLAWNNRFFRENPAFLSVQIGCDYYRGGGEEISVLEIHFHPEYNPKFLKNNLALLRMGTHIMFSRKVGKVKRIIFDRKAVPLPANTNGITIVGWGARTSSGMIYNPWANRLAFTELDFYPLRDCQDIYSRDYVSDKNFCAGFFSKAGGACNRDIGGPGIAAGVLVGVISFGPPICGTVDAPTVFTKVGFYNEWIDQVMERRVPQIVRLSTKMVPKRTFALHYSDRTRKPFTNKPITSKPHHQPKPNLRILQDDKLFKEFMSTMFDDKASREYRETNKKVNVKPTINKHSTYEINSEEARYKKSEYKSKAAKHTLNTKTFAGKDDQEEVKLQQNIVSLLDDLDIYKLMDTDENIKSSDFNSNVNLRAKENNDSSENTGSGESELEDGISKSFIDSVEITNNNNELDEIKTKNDDNLSAEDRNALSNKNELDERTAKSYTESEEITSNNKENEDNLSAEDRNARSNKNELDERTAKSYTESEEIISNNKENEIKTKQDDNLSAEVRSAGSGVNELEENKSRSYIELAEMSGDKNELNQIVKKQVENLSAEVGSAESREKEVEEIKTKSNIEPVEMTSNNNDFNEIKTKQDDNLSEEIDIEGDYELGDVTTKINEDIDTVEKEANELAEILAHDELKVLQIGAEGHLDEILSQGDIESGDSNPHQNEQMEDNVLPSSKGNYNSAYTKGHKNKKINIEEILTEEDNTVTKMPKRDNKRSKTKKSKGITKKDDGSNNIRSTKNKNKLQPQRNKQEDSELHDITMEEVTKQATKNKKRKTKKSKQIKYEIGREHKKNSKSKQKIRKSKNKLNKRDTETGKQTVETKSRNNKKLPKKQAKKKAKKRNGAMKPDLSNYDDHDLNKNEDTNVKSSEDDNGLSIVIDSS